MGFDPQISEWGNPPEHLLLLLRNDAHSVPRLARSGCRSTRRGRGQPARGRRGACGGEAADQE